MTTSVTETIQNSFNGIKQLIRTRTEELSKFQVELAELMQHLHTVYDPRIGREITALEKSEELLVKVKEQAARAECLLLDVLIDFNSRSDNDMLKLIDATQAGVSFLEKNRKLFNIEGQRQQLRRDLCEQKIHGKPFSWWSSSENEIAHAAHTTNADRFFGYDRRLKPKVTQEHYDDYFKKNVHPTF